MGTVGPSGTGRILRTLPLVAQASSPAGCGGVSPPRRHKHAAEDGCGTQWSGAMSGAQWKAKSGMFCCESTHLAWEQPTHSAESSTLMEFRTGRRTGAKNWLTWAYLLTDYSSDCTVN